MRQKNAFDNCLYAVPVRIRGILEKLPNELKNEVQEIRIRNNLPLSLTVGGKPLFVFENGQTSVFKNGAYICERNDTDECLRLLTKHSVFAHTDEIKNGFVRMNCGGRAGICGTFSDSGMISDISGINIRISREIIGCADSIFKRLKGGGTLILGPPGSGKTTIIRDLIRLFSDSGRRVSVVDTRSEISAVSYGVCAYDLGINTDIYIIEKKALGIEMALRTLYPNIIAFDEIGNMEELNAVKESFNAGIDIITSAHVGTFEEISKRELIKNLILTGAVKTVVLLPPKIGAEIKICDCEEIKCLF